MREMIRKSVVDTPDTQVKNMSEAIKAPSILGVKTINTGLSSVEAAPPPCPLVLPPRVHLGETIRSVIYGKLKN